MTLLLYFVIGDSQLPYHFSCLLVVPFNFANNQSLHFLWLTINQSINHLRKNDLYLYKGEVIGSVPKGEQKALHWDDLQLYRGEVRPKNRPQHRWEPPNSSPADNYLFHNLGLRRYMCECLSSPQLWHCGISRRRNENTWWGFPVVVLTLPSILYLVQVLSSSFPIQCSSLFRLLSSFVFSIFYQFLLQTLRGQPNWLLYMQNGQ